jgi:cell division topological specificity factor
MNLLQRLFRRRSNGSRNEAVRRLHFVMNTDRSNLSPEKMEQMKDEILAVISKYVPIARDKVEINVEHRQRDNWLVADIPLLRKLGGSATYDSANSDDA